MKRLLWLASIGLVCAVAPAHAQMQQPMQGGMQRPAMAQPGMQGRPMMQKRMTKKQRMMMMKRQRMMMMRQQRMMRQ